MKDKTDIDVIWRKADAISDRIIDMVNEERLNPDFNPMQMMAGQMLALAGFMATSPEFVRPRAVSEALDAINRCLMEMLEASKRGDL